MNTRMLGIPVWVWIVALCVVAWMVGPQIPSLNCGFGGWRC